MAEAASSDILARADLTAAAMGVGFAAQHIDVGLVSRTLTPEPCKDIGIHA
jgi:hypothetical protein